MVAFLFPVTITRRAAMSRRLRSCPRRWSASDRHVVLRGPGRVADGPGQGGHAIPHRRFRLVTRLAEALAVPVPPVRRPYPL